MTKTSIFRNACFLAAGLALAGCKSKFDPASGAASPAQVVETGNAGLVTVDHPEQYPTVAASRIDEPEKLNVTGSVFPDVSREIPVISMANGRVVDIRARLDDYVKKGQLLFSVQSPDISGAFDTYVKAAADEQLANKAYLRALDLYQHGAISQAMLEQAEDTEKDAKADLVAAEEQLKIFGVDKEHPSPIVKVYAPTSGVIVSQNITESAAAGVALSGTATAFTIADLSSVWIICDVYENDLPKVTLGQAAQIKLTAYPDKTLTGRVSDIGPVLDPTIRTAKVRIQVPNPGRMMRIGMFANATFYGLKKQAYTSVPASAIIHLHDRDWVFMPAPDQKFQRVEVTSGDQLPNQMEQVLSGLQPRQKVVSNALALQTAIDNE